MKRTALINAGLLALLSLLAACSTPMNPAPIVERNNGGPVPPQQQVPPSAPMAPGAPVAGAHSGSEHGYYQVKKGDTLTHIALDNGQSPRDIATWNNLANPNDIKVDQVLRVLPPEDTGGSQAIPVPSLARTPVVPATPVSGTAGVNKVGPRGEKKPYTDTAFADMQKPEAAPVPVTAPVQVALAPAAAPTAADKAAESVSDEAVSWAWPTDGKPMGSYDDAKKGIDIAGKSGQQVMAAANGKVLYVGAMRGYGNLVIVKHSTALLSAYAHNKVILVKEGQNVTKGQPIAEMGDTDADAVKLHFEVRQQGKPVDPTRFLPPR